jgi:hypothetical protein
VSFDRIGEQPMRTPTSCQRVRGRAVGRPPGPAPRGRDRCRSHEPGLYLANVNKNIARLPAASSQAAQVEAYLYETIATLEYIGHPVTRTEIAAVADLDDATVDRTLRDMTERGLLVASDRGSEPAYEPARRDWSVAPGTAHGRVL